VSAPVYARWHRDLGVARAEVDSALAAARDGDLEDMLIYAAAAKARLEALQSAIESGDATREVRP
jgi:hypothetical protein